MGRITMLDRQWLRSGYAALQSAALAGILLAAIPTAGQSQARRTDQEYAVNLNTAVQSVVRLQTFDAAGKALNLGSGFIHRGRVITNRHVLEGAAFVEVFGFRGKSLGLFTYAEQLSYTVDVAILPRVDALTAQLELASRPAAVGQHIFVIGSPLGLENTVSDGIVSARRTVGSQQMLQITAPISSGSSGGPVVDDRGRVVGIATSQLLEGQNLNFAVQVDEIAALAARPPGRFAFPRSNQAHENVVKAEKPVIAATDRRVGLAEVLPSMPFSTIEDKEFNILFYGCYGDSERGTILCVVRPVPRHMDGKNRWVTLYRSVLSSPAGGIIEGSEGFTGLNMLRRTDPDLGILQFNPKFQAGGLCYLVFRTKYPAGISVELALQLGGPFLKRDWTYPVTRVVEIDGSLDPVTKVVFGY